MKLQARLFIVSLADETDDRWNLTFSGHLSSILLRALSITNDVSIDETFKRGGYFLEPHDSVAV